LRCGLTRLCVNEEKQTYPSPTPAQVQIQQQQSSQFTEDIIKVSCLIETKPRIMHTSYPNTDYLMKLIITVIGSIANLKSHYFQPSLSVCMSICVCV